MKIKLIDFGLITILSVHMKMMPVLMYSCLMTALYSQERLPEFLWGSD